jgi:hypothetical protein
MTTLGSSAAVSFQGTLFFTGSAGTSWIANNSPNSIQLSGLTQGLSYLKAWKRVSDNDKGTHLYTSWHIGNGVKNFFTYGDDEGVRVISHKITGGTQNAVYTNKARFKRFEKVVNRDTADKVYMVNRFDTSANGYETFYNDSLSSRKFTPVLIRDITFNWGQETNLKWIARLTVEEIWRGDE